MILYDIERTLLSLILLESLSMPDILWFYAEIANVPNIQLWQMYFPTNARPKSSE